MFLGFKKTKVLAAVIALACMLTYSVSAFAAPTYLTTTQYVTGDTTKATVTTTVSGLNDTAYPGEQTTYLATKSDGTILYIWQAAESGGTVDSGFSFKTDAANADGSGFISVGTMNEGPAAPDAVNTSGNGGMTSATFKTTSFNYSVTFAAKLDSDGSTGGAVFTNSNPGSVTPGSGDLNVAYSPVWGWEPVAIQIGSGSKVYLDATTTPTLAEATSNAFTLPASLITGDCEVDIFFAPIAVSSTTTAPAYVVKEANAVGTGANNAGLAGSSYAGFATAASPAGVSVVKYGILVGTFADLATIDGSNVVAATSGVVGEATTVGSATVYNYPGKALNQFGQFGVKVIDTSSTLPTNSWVRTYVIYSDGTYQLGSIVV